MKKTSAVIAGIVLALAIILIGMQASDKGNGIRTFQSESDLDNFLGQYTDNSYASSTGRAMASAESSDNSKSSSDAPAAEGDGYSRTNNQISNVDEPDFVKNDGDYIYIASNTNLTIISAQAENSRILSMTDVNGTISEISLYKDTLIVMGSENYAYPTLYAEDDTILSDKAQIVPPYYQQRSFIKIYDISDKESPKLIKNVLYDGWYYDARLIGSYLYIITNQPLVKSNDGIIMPTVIDNGVEKRIAASEISYFPAYDYGYQLTTVFALDLADVEQEPSQSSFLTGYTQTLFVSENSIYLTSPKYVSYNDYNKRLIEEVLLPVLDLKTRASAEEIIAGEEEWYQKEEMISVLVSDYYNSLSDNEKADFQEELTEKTIEFEADWQRETQKTTIHKISLDGLDVSYKTRGEVPGHLLNQFSLDEKDNTLRVATTTDSTFGWPPIALARPAAVEASAGAANAGTDEIPDSTTIPESIEPIEPISPPSTEFRSSNNLYILDDDLDIIGSLEDLAPGERIYSARFIEDRAYLVTFKQVDPLFVIDLSNPRDPEILGELKIPGFSTYLHPYDEDTLIGIGQDTDGDVQEGNIVATIPAGLKIALFDISNPTRPEELDRYILGDRGTYSDALYEHKAFFFDKQTNTLVMPVNVQQRMSRSSTMPEELWYPTKTTFMGAYVFDLSNEKIDLTGTITHLNASELSEMSENKDYYYPSYDAQIQRTILIDNSLYTISQREVRVTDISDLSTISQITLPNPYIYYYGREAAI